MARSLPMLDVESGVSEVSRPAPLSRARSAAQQPGRRYGVSAYGAQIAMSQKTVQLIIGRLVTDEELRMHFADHPYETLVHLREQGFELTTDEIAALAESDARMWVSVARRISPRLQRCRLR